MGDGQFQRCCIMPAAAGAYVCRRADYRTMCHWGSTSFLQSQKARIPPSSWSALYCVSESHSHLCCHGMVCLGHRMSLMNHLERQIEIEKRWGSFQFYRKFSCLHCIWLNILDKILNSCFYKWTLDYLVFFYDNSTFKWQ